MDILPEIIPRLPNLKLTQPFLCPSLQHVSFLCLYFGSFTTGGVKAIEAILGSSQESETGLLKDESSRALSQDMFCVRK